MNQVRLAFLFIAIVVAALMATGCSSAPKTHALVPPNPILMEEGDLQVEKEFQSLPGSLDYEKTVRNAKDEDKYAGSEMLVRELPKKKIKK